MQRLPGLNPRRLVGLMSAAVRRCELDLSGFVVFTEAASGAYVVTPVLAAMAGASHVYALTRSTRHGSVAEIATTTQELARLAGVSERVEIVTEKLPQAIARADLVTNSGHVRPIDSSMIAHMKPTAVIPLMYESWELREADVDLQACRQRGIRVTGTNERHAAVDVFSFLGMMAVKLLLDAGVGVHSSRILLLCNNPFGPFIERQLAASQAAVDCVAALTDARRDVDYDAIIVSLTPVSGWVLSDADVATVARQWPGAVLTIFWGDVDRSALSAAGLNFWPIDAPGTGHMGILPSGVGPEPIVRLQSGSLKAGEAMLRYASNAHHPAHQFGQPLHAG